MAESAAAGSGGDRHGSERPPFAPDDVVMVADDEMFTRFIIEEILQGLGKPKVLTARDGVEAEAALSGPDAGRVRLATLDFNMPNRNGLEVLKSLRCGRLGAPRGTPVIMITGMDDLTLAGAALALDVDAFLHKPVSSSDLFYHLAVMDAPDRECKSVEAYEAIPIDMVAEAMPADSGDVSALVRVELRDLTAGMVLARDIGTPNGALLVARGTQITNRMARLLHGLAAGGLPLDFVFVEPL